MGGESSSKKNPAEANHLGAPGGETPWGRIIWESVGRYGI